VSDPYGEQRPAQAPLPARWWQRAVLEQERRGELLVAFDLAERGLGEHPGDVWLEHRAVLALARTGATEEAQRRFTEYGLEEAADEDVAALGARIAKDTALAAAAGQARPLATRAAALYREIFARTGGYYPAINAATLYMLAGEDERSQELARTVLALLQERADDSYYAAATEAEARLLLAEEAPAREALERAGRRYGNDYAAVATTRRQLRLICRAKGLDEQILALLAGPAVVHFCGHRVGTADDDTPFPAREETLVAARIAAEVERNRAGFAYGSLASGADILWAEALLAAGSELHVILPFSRDEFLSWSVEPAGPAWVERFERCMAAATSVRYATEDAFLGDDVLFRYCSELAMGLALLRARYLDAEARQLAVWDGEPARGAAGTALDVETWRRTGNAACILAPGRIPARRDAGGPSPGREESLPREPPASETRQPHRVVRAMLFGDIKGFSKLTDDQLPSFLTLVMGAFAAVLARHREQIWHRNTWGDALYVVLTDAVQAAACALDLQEALAAIDLEANRLPAHLALRLGGHLGPVFQTRDPVLEEVAFIGSHVSRTARIEPVTPPAAVYVTEPFAAALTLRGGHPFVCDYVGHMPAAKDYGRLRMHRLHRRESSAA